MKKYSLIFLFLAGWLAVNAQQVLSLEDCRNLAIQNNKQLKISNENIRKVEEDKKAAFTKYLPDISLTGAYLYNQKNISILSEDKYLPIGTVMSDGSFGFTPEQIKNEWTMAGNQPVPLDADGQPFNPAQNPDKILWKEHAIIPKSAFEMNIHNVFVGGLSIVQPVFMGGKIIAYNQIMEYARALAESQKATTIQELNLQINQTYWQTVSLSNKRKLSEKLVTLLQQMNNDVEAMIDEGVATRADGLTVKVKLNEAEMTQTQADNGLQLCKMLLCQLCGLPLEEPVVLVDENQESLLTNVPLSAGNVQEAWSNRSEIKSLDLATKIFKKKEAVVRADMLPTVALTGNYLVSNPNSFNGFQNKFAGSWNVGVMVNVPLFHWGEQFHQLKSAQAETRVKHLEMDEAKEKIELQVNQSKFKVAEARKRMIAATKNKESAEENLRYADISFKEGVIPISNVTEAQTAWFKAQTDFIDAQIALRLGEAELNRALGK
ncbi:alkaline protease [Bacteroidia bacterium]|nr:alkaline protease [Bacteroidia bacterium]